LNWYQDYRDNNTVKTAHLPGATFLETFLQHILPPGIHNKRRYGFWGYRVRSENLTRIRVQLGVPPVVYAYRENNDEGKAVESGEPDEPRARHCAVCKDAGTGTGTFLLAIQVMWSDVPEQDSKPRVSAPIFLGFFSRSVRGWQPGR
jgi:hypothetical protein